MKKYIVRVNGTAYEVEIEEVTEESGSVEPVVKSAPVKVSESKAPKTSVGAGTVVVKAPMAGKILKVLVNVGDKVTKGQTMFVLEALKMENNIPAPQDGTVASIAVKAGSDVETDAVVAKLD